MTVMEIAKPFVKTGTNEHMQRFCDTEPRL